VVLEYHPAVDSGLDPRAETVRLLGAAGMRTLPIWDADRDGFGMMWAWRD
jgi:hypothetical protein